MRLAGGEITGRWREAGAWWEGEGPQEVIRWRDQRGISRESIQPLPSFSLGSRIQAMAVEEASPNEDISLRPRKVRDVKVAEACGLVAPPPEIKIRRVEQKLAALHIVSGLSFGRSPILPSEAPRIAADRGYRAAALVDRFSLAGAWEFVRECRRIGIQPLVGSTIELAEGGEIVLIARDKVGWQHLSRLITECHLSQPRLFPLASMDLLRRFGSPRLLCLTGGDAGPLNRLVLRQEWKPAKEMLRELQTIFSPQCVFVQIERSWLPWDVSVNRWLRQLADHLGASCLAAIPACHAAREDYPVQDVLVCSHSLCLIEEVIGRKPTRADCQPPGEPRPARHLNAERHLLTAADFTALYADEPDLIENAWNAAQMCDPDVMPTRTRLPQLYPDDSHALREKVEIGARERWRKITPNIRRRLDYEMERIIPLQFAPHFLIMEDACRWATERGILYSGRGSVVDSAVAYCLGLTRIDAIEHQLHFDRFLPDDGSKRPDIDIDFEAARRDDIRNYLVEKYHKENVATVSAFGAFCVRGIVREVGKTLGLPDELISFLAKRIHGGVSPAQLEKAIATRPELVKCNLPKERLEWIFRLSQKLMDVPRNIRAHSSGVVISDRPLWETVPVQLSGVSEFEDEPGTVRIIQWDKRSAKHNFDKFDILCLRGQDVLSGSERRIREREPNFRAEQAPLDDPETYRTMRAGELIGIPQSASPAMRQAHMRLETQNLTDASLVQAGIRPGVGGAVKINELIARRRGLKPYAFEHPELERILGHTYGIIVFQEQVDQLLQAFVGCSSGEAEEIREEIHKRRREDYGQVIRGDLMARMNQRGISEAVALHVFDLISGFRGYGFAQGHALAFAEISVRSIYCQQNYPAEYFAALFDAQPAGYYGPCTLANEARLRGVKLLPPRLGLAPERFRVETITSEMDPQITLPYAGLRVGLRQISQLSHATRDRMLKTTETEMLGFLKEVRPARPELEHLIQIGFFEAFHPNRRALIWAAERLAQWAGQVEGELGFRSSPPEIPADVAEYSLAERRVQERRIFDLDIDEHLMAFERTRVQNKGGISAHEAKNLAPKTKAVVVGNPIRLRFPPTPSGRRVVFFDLEDETGLLNVTCFDEAYRRDGHAIICSPYVTVIGQSQWRDGHTAFLAHRVFPYEPVIRKLALGLKELPVVQSDFLVG